jgi:hypothetical protein
MFVQVLDQPPEGGAPVAEVVDPDHAAAQVTQNPDEASPMTVLRMWPTCSSFAIFGPE